MIKQQYKKIFGLYFLKIDHTLASAKYIEKLWVLISILFCMYIKIARFFGREKHSDLQTNRITIVRSAYKYGSLISDIEEKNWIDCICRDLNLSQSERVLLGFDHIFVRLQRGQITIMKEITEKITFILLLAFFVCVLGLQFLLSVRGIVLGQAWHKLAIFCIFWWLTLRSCYVVIMIIKGDLWDSHKLMKKMLLHQNTKY